MDRSDFTTHVVVAVSAFLATLPALISPPQGPKDLYKVIFVLGPIAMVSLAVYGRRREVASRAAHDGGQKRAGVRLVDATDTEEGSANEERSRSTSEGAGTEGSKPKEEMPDSSTRRVKP